MRDAVLRLLGTEHGLAIAVSFIGAALLLCTVVLVRCRMRVGRLRANLASAETTVSSLITARAVGAKELDAAKARVEEMEATYSEIIDIDRELASRKGDVALLETQISDLRSSYAEKRELYDRLSREIAIFEDRISLADIGMFRPVISLGSTAEYEKAIEAVRERQKDMISKRTAIVCPTTWMVSGSESKGRTMINRNIRMTLRAYNNECEVLINRVSWKNYESIRARMQRCRQTYDALNESLGIVITGEFERLKLEELRLVYEEALKHQQEKDRIREEKEREREEAKAQRELRAEIARSERREREREEALAAARSELAAATEAERFAYQARVAELEQELAKAREQTERTKSMAEQTRIGHVYIISNVGAFGEDVFKIGMTRRLEPLDRIRELGDASVPFPFEVHALIFTEDAPSLERELHAAMEDARINRVNLRKEFFRVPSARIAQIIRERFPDVVYIEHPQSQEFLGSISRRALEAAMREETESRIPASI